MASCISSPFAEHIRIEALELLIEARDDQRLSLSQKRERRDSRRSVPTFKEFQSTAQLSWVVAWVLYQKAVWSGEISQSKAQQLLPPLEPSCLSPNMKLNEMGMQDGVRRRLERIQRLYDRAVRLGCLERRTRSHQLLFYGSE